jgi:hypothetical protein
VTCTVCDLHSPTPASTPGSIALGPSTSRPADGSRTSRARGSLTAAWTPRVRPAAGENGHCPRAGRFPHGRWFARASAPPDIHPGRCPSGALAHRIWGRARNRLFQSPRALAGGEPQRIEFQSVDTWSHT